MENRFNSVDALVLTIAGSMIGIGLCGMYYETKVMPDLQSRIEALQSHNDSLREYIRKSSNDILQLFKEELKGYGKDVEED